MSNCRHRLPLLIQWAVYCCGGPELAALAVVIVFVYPCHQVTWDMKVVPASGHLHITQSSTMFTHDSCINHFILCLSIDLSMRREFSSINVFCMLCSQLACVEIGYADYWAVIDAKVR